MSGTREFSQTAYKKGDLKRRMPVATFGQLTAGAMSTIIEGVVNFRLILKGLNSSLGIHVLVAPVGNNISNPIKSSQIPAGAITMQLTPVVILGDSAPIFLRPVFQDPTLTSTDNGNHPLPMDCPFGWEFSTIADEVYIDIAVNADAFVATELEGSIVCAVELEYESGWNYPEALLYALNQVQLVAAATGVQPFSTAS